MTHGRSGLAKPADQRLSSAPCTEWTLLKARQDAQDAETGAFRRQGVGKYVVESFEEGGEVHNALASFLRLTGVGGQSLQPEIERMLDERLSEANFRSLLVGWAMMWWIVVQGAEHHERRHMIGTYVTMIRASWVLCVKK